MKFNDEDIVCEPGHETRTWQSCNYTVNGVRLFHERTFVRSCPTPVHKRTLAQSLWALGGPSLGESAVQWFKGHGTKKQIEVLAERHGGVATEEFYPQDENNPEYFLSFWDTDKAIAFCHTGDFDLLCLDKAEVFG